MQVTSVQLQKNDNTINTDTVELDADVPTRFECNVIPSTSRPPPTVIWYIGSTVQQNSTNTSYTVTATETDHDKIIYCKAYNLQPESQAVESVKPKLYVRGNVKRYIIFKFMKFLYLMHTGDQQHVCHPFSFNLFSCIQDNFLFALPSACILLETMWTQGAV